MRQTLRHNQIASSRRNSEGRIIERLEHLEEERATLEEELRQLRAAVLIYNEVVRRLQASATAVR